MAELFGGLTGFRFPDARINGGGPLPTSLSGPAGIHGDPDGRYNATSELLSGIVPYAGPKGGRMGSDRNYQQIPHRRMFFVPRLWLPSPNGESKFEMSHAVDNGDMAFLVRLNQKSIMLFERAPPAGVQNYTNVDVLVNLPTANYLLRGLMDHETRRRNGQLMPFDLWRDLYQDMRLDQDEENICNKLLRRFIPIGICAGSEKQGGLHETGLSPVQAACSHVTTLTLDGQNRDLVNYWQAEDLSAGDILIFRMGVLETQAYTLNHYYKGVVSKCFDRKQPCLQIVPDVQRPFLSDPQLERLYRENTYASKKDVEGAGWWRVAQTFTSKLKYRNHITTSDDTMYMQGQLLQVTFAPVWMEFMGEYATEVAGSRVMAVPVAAIPVDIPTAGVSTGVPARCDPKPAVVPANVAVESTTPAAAEPAAAEPSAAEPSAAEPAAAEPSAAEPSAAEPAAAEPAAAGNPESEQLSVVKKRRTKREDLLADVVYSKSVQ
jgi:hypothetical protein